MAVRAVDVIVLSIFMLYTASTVVSLDLATLLRSRQNLAHKRAGKDGKHNTIYIHIYLSIQGVLQSSHMNNIYIIVNCTSFIGHHVFFFKISLFF